MTTVRGVVKDSTGKPIEGARIRVRRPRAGDDPAAAIGDAVESAMPGMNMGGGGSGCTAIISLHRDECKRVLP